MIEIRDLLKRFEHVLASEEGKKESIRRAISDTLGIEIATKDIAIKNHTVFLNVRPLHKNEIFLKKDAIQARLAEILPGKSGPEIR